MLNAEALWQLAAWYREFAERTGNTIIWEGRLRTAEALEAEAAEIASRSVPDAQEAISDPPAEAPVQREQMIRERAYALWEKEGRPDGRSVAHWLQAEAEIDQQRTRIPVHYHD